MFFLVLSHSPALGYCGSMQRQTIWQKFKSYALNPLISYWKQTKIGICAEILSRSDKRKTAAVAVIQTLLGSLDLIGVSIVGLLGAITINGVQSKSPEGTIQKILELSNLDNLSFQSQVVVLAILASTILAGRTILSAYLVRKTLFFLSRRSASITSDLLQKLLSSSILTIQTKTTQNLIYSLTGGVSAMTVGVLGFSVNMIADIALLIVLTTGLFVINPISAAATILFFGFIGFILFKVMQQRAQQIGQLISDVAIDSNERILEALTAYREIQVKSRRQHYIQIISRQRFELSNFEAERAFMPNVSKYVMEIGILVGALLMSAAQFLTTDAITAISSLFIFLAAGMRIAPAVLRVQQGFLGIRLSFGAATPALELIALLGGKPKLEVGHQSLTVEHTGFHGEIEISKLTFTFPDSDKTILNSVSLYVPNGTSMAVVGPSGAGKTTLIDNLLGVLAPQSGKILISGETPSEAANRWPGAIAYVPQDVSIFNGTIAENVALGFELDEIKPDLIWDALRTAQLDEFVKSLPQGIDSSIGEKGSNLSGGQRQRLGIARALYTKPRLLVLDEATSALDGEVEESITGALTKLRGSVTIVLIAHRLSTVRNSDQVIYLEDGIVLSKGNFDQVRKEVPNFDRQASLMGQ